MQFLVGAVLEAARKKLNAVPQHNRCPLNISCVFSVIDSTPPCNNVTSFSILLLSPEHLNKMVLTLNVSSFLGDQFELEISSYGMQFNT